MRILEAMRTTITLDADIARRLKAMARETGLPFKVVVNDHLRRGLDQREAEPIAPFVVVTRPMGLRAGLSLDSASALFDALDGPQAR